MANAQKKSKNNSITGVGTGGKRIRNIREKVDAEKVYTLQEAISLVKEVSTLKFDETIELALRLGIDPRHSDQNVRGVVSMPHGVGKTAKVAVFARDDKAEEAKKAGADIVGAEDLVEEILQGNINFDKAIATPDMMSVVSKAAKTLGPKGLMPNPKLGTVTKDIAEAVKNAKSGQVEFRAEKNGIIHAGLGKVSFGDKELIENINAFVGAIEKAKPSSLKGIYMTKASVSSTMGPGVTVDVSTLTA